jgi:hypothetical protein
MTIWKIKHDRPQGMNRVLLVYLFLLKVIACDARNLESDGRKRSESNVNIRIQGDNLHGENLLVQYIESRIELKKKELAQTDVNNFDYEHIQKELKIYQEDLERLKKETQLWDNYSNAKKSGDRTRIAKADHELAVFIATQNKIHTGQPVPKDPKLKEVIQGLKKSDGASEPVDWKRLLTLVGFAVLSLGLPFLMWRRVFRK